MNTSALFYVCIAIIITSINASKNSIIEKLTSLEINEDTIEKLASEMLIISYNGVLIIIMRLIISFVFIKFLRICISHLEGDETTSYYSNFMLGLRNARISSARIQAQPVSDDGCVENQGLEGFGTSTFDSKLMPEAGDAIIPSAGTQKLSVCDKDSVVNQLFERSETAYCDSIMMPGAKDVRIPSEGIQSSYFSENGYECPVCVNSQSEVLAEGGSFFSMKCGHIYCKKCIDDFLRYRKECPLCKLRSDRRSLRKIFL